VRKDLSAVNRIDLTGLVPAARLRLESKEPEDRRWKEEKVVLPVKERGVYLVRAEGAASAASVVILSDLKLEVQAEGGRVRVYATHARTGAPVNEAYIKVAESGNLKAQGFTDARGVFDAGPVGASFSVVGEKDGSYALVRK
jgi:uncharacterized protein YfaS (alpha-2-macroglobulin family)